MLILMMMYLSSAGKSKNSRVTSQVEIYRVHFLADDFCWRSKEDFNYSSKPKYLKISNTFHFACLSYRLYFNDSEQNKRHTEFVCESISTQVNIDYTIARIVISLINSVYTKGMIIYSRVVYVFVQAREYRGEASRLDKNINNLGMLIYEMIIEGLSLCECLFHSSLNIDWNLNLLKFFKGQNIKHLTCQIVIISRNCPSCISLPLSESRLVEISLTYLISKKDVGQKWLNFWPLTKISTD